MTLEEICQQPEKHKENMQRITGRINDAETRIGSTSVGNAEKAIWKAGSVQSIENRQCYETAKERRKFFSYI